MCLVQPSQQSTQRGEGALVPRQTPIVAVTRFEQPPVARDKSFRALWFVPCGETDGTSSSRLVSGSNKATLGKGLGTVPFSQGICMVALDSEEDVYPGEGFSNREMRAAH